jgi:hypothetical protein
MPVLAPIDTQNVDTWLGLDWMALAAHREHAAQRELRPPEGPCSCVCFDLTRSLSSGIQTLNTDKSARSGTAS